MEQLGINPIFLLSQIVNFAVLAFLLWRFAYKPLFERFDERSQRIEKGLEDARLAEEALANAESERQQILDQARGEAQEIVAEASQRGEAQAAKIVEDAENEARAIIEDARAEAQVERNRMLGEMRGQISTLAIAAANQIVKVTLDEQRQMELVNEFFSGVRSGRVKIAEKVQRLDGDRAVVTSALPLSEGDKATYRSYLKAQLGADATVEFRTDPGILGGVVLRVGDLVVDDSVSGRLGALRQRLT